MCTQKSPKKIMLRDKKIVFSAKKFKAKMIMQMKVLNQIQLLSCIPSQVPPLPSHLLEFFFEWCTHIFAILFWPYMVFKSVCPLWDEIDVVHHNHHHHDVLETLFVNSTCDITIFLKLLSCHSARHSWQ